MVVTSGVTSIVRGAVRYMTQCDHEEADTRMLIHLLDALRNGCTNCLVRTVDTDVLVILLGKFHHLVSLCQDVHVWVVFGSGKNYTHYHINAIYEDWVGENVCPFLSFIASQVVILPLLSLEEARSQHGKHGSAFQM